MQRVGSATRLGAIVRNNRIKRGMTQIELAKASGLSEKSIVTLEMGRSEGIRFDKMRAVLKVFDLCVYVGERPARQSHRRRISNGGNSEAD